MRADAAPVIARDGFAFGIAEDDACAGCDRQLAACLSVGIVGAGELHRCSESNVSA